MNIGTWWRAETGHDQLKYYRKVWSSATCQILLFRFSLLGFSLDHFGHLFLWLFFLCSRLCKYNYPFYLLLKLVLIRVKLSKVDMLLELMGFELTADSAQASGLVISNWVFHPAGVVPIMFICSLKNGQRSFSFLYFDLHIFGVFNDFAIKFPCNLWLWITSKEGFKLAFHALFDSLILDFLSEFGWTFLFCNKNWFLATVKMRFFRQTYHLIVFGFLPSGWSIQVSCILLN